MSAWEAIGATDEWYTPRYIFDALGEQFDLDVAAPEGGPRHVPLSPIGIYFFRGALQAPWQGFVWMNPPYGGRGALGPWLDRFFRHRNGIALVPDRTSAPWFHGIFHQADAVLFVSRKIKFERPDGTTGDSPGSGSALIARGTRAVAALERASRSGLGGIAYPSKVAAE